eukprot:gnl/TRDRNA2_/TRDRNA2_152476_c0_seq6.p1 gnl/TRDRNA2_/TRDRNA2_152476_c0~~gnl/TRDRNA2_/TRDRNA2_152476_c0_seq6.p1  ORF type:complete len:228 (-),score=69.20 gnl/TRDRNA2_/TRDRNA2_152476_c0_seq6:178-861(-)
MERAKKEAEKEKDNKWREEFCKERADAQERYEAQKQKAAAAMEKFDTDHSGELEADEIKKLLCDTNMTLAGKDRKPTEEECDTLITLCDKSGDGKISKNELLGAMQAWFAYIEKYDEVEALMGKYDLSKTGVINHGELKPLLKEMNGGKDIPEDVLKWVWKQADLSGDGCLNRLELMRAVAAWYVWKPGEQEEETGVYAKNMDKEQMPDQFQGAPAKRKTSSVCAVL